MSEPGPGTQLLRGPLFKPCQGLWCTGLATCRPGKRDCLEHDQEPPGQVQGETGRGWLCTCVSGQSTPRQPRPGERR